MSTHTAVTKAMTRVTKAKTDRDAATERYREAMAVLARALADAHASGSTWQELGDLLGVSAEAARQRSFAADEAAPPSVRARAESGRKRTSARRQDLPGISIAEAAGRMGVTRAWAHRLAKRGDLPLLPAEETGGALRVDPSGLPG